MSYKPILEEIIPKLWVGDKEGYPIAERRRKLFRKKKDFNHFREHVRDSFTALGLKLFEVNPVD